MNKIMTLAAAAMLAATATAQTTARLSANTSSINFAKITEQTTTVTLNRLLFQGYNTICLPFDVSAEDLVATVGEGAQIERLAKAEGDVLYFLDVTSEGIAAGQPYLIYSPARQNVAFTTTQTQMTDPQDLTVDGVTMGSAYAKHTPTGVYGIPAQQDTDELASILISVDGDKSFLPTRCQIATASSSPEIRHITSLDQATDIRTLIAQNTAVNVYNTQGALVKAGVTISQAMATLPQGIYVAAGQKFIVK